MRTITTGLCTGIGLLLLTLGAIAAPKSFTYGCGTGCAVRADCREKSALSQGKSCWVSFAKSY
ncbi:MAG: hypothetical protein HC919_09610 [Oscillatoriales cyanobacterium SM2_2_1]|nr:hypothetical protein [Oscillatoriales cyanobacterium SM2_2_1]